MIKTFRHKGFQKFFETGSKAGILPKHKARLQQQLTVLNVSTRPEHMNIPGWDWHPLKGNLAGHWSISVSGNWRITFAFADEDAVFVDYQDYH